MIQSRSADQNVVDSVAVDIANSANGAAGDVIFTNAIEAHPIPSVQVQHGQWGTRHGGHVDNRSSAEDRVAPVRAAIGSRRSERVIQRPVTLQVVGSIIFTGRMRPA